MIIFTISSDTEPELILVSDPVPLKQIFSEPGGSGSGSTALLIAAGI
jgi:hypothetical protein